MESSVKFQFAIDEFRAELIKRFGYWDADWEFVCTSCGIVQVKEYEFCNNCLWDGHMHPGQTQIIKTDGTVRNVMNIKGYS